VNARDLTVHVVRWNDNNGDACAVFADIDAATVFAVGLIEEPDRVADCLHCGLPLRYSGPEDGWESLDDDGCVDGYDHEPHLFDDSSDGPYFVDDELRVDLYTREVR
jgi:hypothetical protein